MNFEQLFEGNEQKKIRGHFENMIDMAKSDGQLSSDELVFLTKMAQRFGISEEKFESMLDKGNQYAFNPPVSRQDRYDRFINLVRIIVVDNITDPFEIRALKRFAAGLDIEQDRVEPLVDSISRLIKEGLDNDDIIDQLKL